MKTGKDKLRFFDNLYEQAREYRLDLAEELEHYRFQYKNGYSGKYGGAPYKIVRNITYELVESQINTDIPVPSVDPAPGGDKKRQKNAQTVKTLLSSLIKEQPFSRINDMDERYTYIYGGSVWVVEWDENKRKAGCRGDVCVFNRSPVDFIGQPGIYEITDMEYCFLEYDTTLDELERKYGISDAEKDRLLCSDDGSDTVRVRLCYYMNEEGRVSRFIWSKDRILSDIDDYYSRKRLLCPVCSGEYGRCSCSSGSSPVISSENFEIIEKDMTLSDGRVIKAGTKVPYYTPSRFPVLIRKNTSAEKTLLGQSDCSFIEAQQEEINKILSRVHEKMIMSGVYPYKPDDCRFRYDNSIGGKVLDLRTQDKPDSFGVLDTTPDISRDLVYVESIYKDAKKTLGISDAFVGDDEDNAKSGVARQIQVAQSEGRLVSKKIMKDSLYSELYRLIFEMYLAYADERRPVSDTDAFGKIIPGSFSRYDFLEYDDENGSYYYDDAYLFSADTDIPSSDLKSVLWSINLENYRSGGFGEPSDPMTLARYWCAQKRCGYPGAEANMKFFIYQEE